MPAVSGQTGEGRVLVGNGGRISLDRLSEDVKQATEVLSKAVNQVWYLYDVVFCDLEELHITSAGKEPAEPVDFPQCDSLYNSRCHSELNNKTP